MAQLPSRARGPGRTLPNASTSGATHSTTTGHQSSAAAILAGCQSAAASRPPGRSVERIFTVCRLASADMAIDRRPFAEIECIADYERRLTALVKRLLATEANIERRCQLLDAWLELNPLPRSGAQMEYLARFVREAEGGLLGPQR